MMSDQATATIEGPYARAAGQYWAAGWRGVLPLPKRRKKSPPEGFTGAGGIFPSYPDVQAWIDGGHADGNIALRFPDGILGVDVDHYDSKTGGDTIAKLEAELGPLPATWRTTSRDDGISGIRLYRVPEGMRWPGIVGHSVETVRYAHRYAVVWPSIHPDTGGTYRWVDPHGATSLTTIPTVDDLPELPDAWVQHLTGGEAATDQPRANISDAQAAQWVHAHGAGDLCRKMREVVMSSLPTISSAGSRHDTVMTLTNRLVWLVGAGHCGGVQALDIIRTAFRAAASDRTEQEFAGEWDRLIVGAVKRAAAEYPNGTTDDPCVRPFPAEVEAYVASLVDRPVDTPSASTAEADDAVELTIKRNQYASQELERLRAQRAAQRLLEAEDEDDVIADRVRRRVIDDKALAAYKKLTEPPAPPFDLGTLADVLARPPEPPMRVEGLIPWSGSALVVAQRKTGKTTFLLNYARAMLTGEPFLGCYDVIALPPEARVAFLNYEVSGTQLARWANDAGVPQDRLVLVNLRGRRNPLGNDEDRQHLAAALRDANVQAVIVDPFGRAYTGVSQNDNGEVQAFLVGLEEFVRSDVGALDLLLAAHAGWDGERTRGASALEDWGDTIITLTKDDEDRRYLRAIGRDVDVDEDELVMDEATRVLSLTGLGGRKRQNRDRKVTNLSVYVARVVEQLPVGRSIPSKSALIELLLSQPDYKGPKNLKNGPGGAALNDAVAVAEGAGRVVVDKGTNGTSWRITRTDATDATGVGCVGTDTDAPPLYRGASGVGRKTPLAGGDLIYDSGTGQTLDAHTGEVVK